MNSAHRVFSALPVVLLLALPGTGAGGAAAEPLVNRDCTVLDLSGAGTKSSKLVLLPTTEGGAASGTVRAGVSGDVRQLRVDIRDLPPAELVGFQYLTYVLWSIDTDGSFRSLGELPLKNGRARTEVNVDGPIFGLLVTAEPYFSVERPSSAVLLAASPDARSAKNVAVLSASCNLVDGAYYAFGRDAVAVALTLDRAPKTPDALLQARHAFEIAKLAGGSTQSPDDFRATAAKLLEAETAQSAKPGNPATISAAREIVGTAESIRAQAELATAAAREAAERRAADERAAAERAAVEGRQRAAAEAAERAAQAKRLQEETDKRVAAERTAQRLKEERAAAADATPQPTIVRKVVPASTATAAAAAAETPATAGTPVDDSLVAERARLVAERARLAAEQQKSQADTDAAAARIESERATLRAQLAEENAARERDTTATVRAEVEQARRQAEQARLEAETARREAELAAERARIEVERAQLEAQKKTLTAEAALREQLRNEAAQRSAVRTEADRQAELDRMRQQLELEMQQRELERDRGALAARQLAEQQAVEQKRAELDNEREQIVAQLQADQAQLAEERAEMERLRLEDEARREAQAQQAKAAREQQLEAERATLRAELEAEQRRLAVERGQQQAALEEEQRQLQQSLEAERARLRAEMEAERERLRREFERQREELARTAAASEEQRVLRAESERAERRERLLTQLKEVLDASDTERGLLVSLSGVGFAAGQHELQPVAREKLARVAGILLANPSLVVAVEGHTDSTGSAEGNQLLSERRANAVRDFFLSQGVKAESMSARGLGASVPIASNDTSEGRRANRRIELTISGAAIDR